VVALDAINAATRSALGELRALLAVLRSAGAEVAPLPTLADLRALAEQAGAAGVTVRTRIDGDPATVPRAVSLSAYRIVQEAVTNAVKHAAPAEVAVEVLATAGRVAVEVTNGAGGAPAAAGVGAGAGLAGMRERVAAFGGTLDAGPSPAGGWTVRATLPYDEMGDR
jgi:signal transduction histidine kinase